MFVVAPICISGRSVIKGYVVADGLCRLIPDISVSQAGHCCPSGPRWLRDSVTEPSKRARTGP